MVRRISRAKEDVEERYHIDENLEGPFSINIQLLL